MAIFNFEGKSTGGATTASGGSIFGSFGEPDEAQKKAIRAERVSKKLASSTALKKRRKAIDEGLNRGLSFEDIAAQSGLPLESVRNYAGRTRPEYGIDTRNVIVRNVDQNIKSAKKAVGAVKEGLTTDLRRVGEATGETLFSGIDQGKSQLEFEQGQGVLNDVIKRADLRLKDKNLDPALRSRLTKLREETIKSRDKLYGTQTARQNEVIERTDPVKGAASIASLGFDVLTAGSVGGAAKAGVRGAGRVVARNVASGAAQGAVSGGLSAVEQNGADVTRQDIQGGALTGAVLGGGLAAGGAALGAGIKRLRTPKEIQKAAKVAGPVTGETKTALAKIDTPELKAQIQATFGAKNKQKLEAVAARSGAQTSRAKQFIDNAEREIIEQIEGDSSLVKSGQVQTQMDTINAALERGPMDLTNVQVGAKIDAVDVARAKMSMTPYLDEVIDSIKSGDTKRLQEAYQSAAAAKEGYQLLTGEAGRALGIQNAFSNKTMQAFDAIADYQKTIVDGVPPTKQQLDYMNTLLKEASDEVEASKLDKAKSALYAGETSIIRKLEEYATAAKLTSPTTHLRNIIGNTLTFGQRAVEQGIATGIGAARGRTSLRAIPRVLGTRAGYKEATSKFLGILNDTINLRATSDNLAAKEGFKPAIKGKLGEAIRTPFKILEAADEFGKAILRDSRLNQEAFEMATKEGFKGDDLITRVEQLVRNPTEDMVKKAQKDALEFTYQKDLGKIGKGIQDTVNSMPGGKFFVPFIKTPTNIVKFQLSRSAVGAPGQAITAIAKRGTREGDEAIAKALTGTLLSVGTYSWVRDNADKITGAAPKSQAERDAFYAEGKQPFSIKVGDKWISYQSFQPAGLYLLQAKSMADAVDNNDNKSAAGIASAMAQTAAQGILELPFVQGVNNVVEALADPEKKAEDFVASTIKGFVPNALRDVRLYADPIIRSPKNLKESVFDMIPGLSDDLDERTTVLGQTAERKDSPLARSLFRVFGTKEQIPPEEFKVLQGVAKNTEYSVSAPARTQGGKKLDKTEYNKYQRVYYKRFKNNLSSLMDSRSFQDSDWEGKKERIQSIVTKSGKEARAEFFKK